MLKTSCALTLFAVLGWNIALAQFMTGNGNGSMTSEQANDCIQNPNLCRNSVPSDSAGNPIQRLPSFTGPIPDGTAIRVDETSVSPTRPQLTLPQTLVPVLPEPPTEFQQLVESSVGSLLPLFGYNLFQNVPTTFAPVDRIPVPANYVIGPGDELMIRAWGQIDVDARVIVDRNGQIYLPRVGSVAVAGVTYDQLSDRIKAAIGRVFRNFDLRVSMGQLRSIQIFVVGYARQPGSYTVSSLSTLVNALFASGGPSTHGTLRHIQLKRGNQVVTDFDMYDLLLKGDKSKDTALLPGDVIYIPPTGPQVAVAGSVNFPAVYELHSTSTLGEQLEIAGGLTSVADGQRVIVERVENHTTRKVEEFTLDSAGRTRQLHDGDVVRIFSISPRFEDTVALRGNVADPGRYPFRSGMRIRDLIPNREFLLTREFWRNQNAAGNPASTDVALNPVTDPAASSVTIDRIPTSNLASDSASKFTTQMNGDNISRQQRQQTIAGEAELRNDIKRSAPDINWDYAVIQRINHADLSTSLIPFNLGKAILDRSEEDNVELQAGDVVTIFSQSDIAVSNEHRSKFVRLEGEFRAPGVYRVNPGETLQSLIARAGGLTSDAYVYGSKFTREAARVEQQASLDQMMRDIELEAQHNVLYAASTRPEQQQQVQGEIESQRLLLQRLRGVKASGRIVLQITPSQADIEAFPPIELEDGDTLFVPHKSSTVSVVGSVYNQNSFLFRTNTRISDYLKLSGGGTRDADMKRAFVIRANGSVLSRTNTPGVWSGGVNSIRTLPGDTVVVPPKLDKGSTLRAIKDWSQVVGQIGLGAAAINVLK